MLSNEELIRYARQITLPGFGMEGQLRLKQGRVLVVGAGGLGSPVLMYLAAAGVGHIGIVEFDRVDTSNLQRQILYTQDEVGQSKVEMAADRLRRQNPAIQVEVFPVVLSSANAMDIIRNFDVVVDGSDNLPTRYLVNDACVLLNKVLVYGAIFQFEGQVSVFNMPDKNGERGPNYRDLFPVPPPPEMVPSCAEGGVVGALPGIIGALQANEAIKILAGTGTTLSGRLWLFDGLEFITRQLKIRRDPSNPLTGENPTQTTLIDYDSFCHPAKAHKVQPETEISVSEFNWLIKAGHDIQIIDVREAMEYDIVNIGGLNIPLSTIRDSVEQIRREGMVVVHCRSGQRSRKAVDMLMQDFKFSNVRNLQGGLLAWRDQVDPAFPIR